MKKMLAIILVAILFPLTSVEAKKAPSKIIKISYLNTIFGHVHRNPSRYSSSLTTISCGHPIKVLKQNILGKGQWAQVKVGAHKGFINLMYLSDKRPACFQDRFPRFFDNLDLELTDLYYWGKLYDQYVIGRTKVQ